MRQEPCFLLTGHRAILRGRTVCGRSTSVRTNGLSWMCRCECVYVHKCVCVFHVIDVLIDVSLSFSPQSLNIRHNDILTIFDGHDLMSHVIGQYLGSRERFRVVSGGSEVTVQFQSDPDDSTFILSQGFLIHYRGKSINIHHTKYYYFFCISVYVQYLIGVSLHLIFSRGGA